MSTRRRPVLVGAGVASQREDDPLRAVEAIELMARALARAGADAGAAGLLREADSIRVTKGFWGYSDPGRLLARQVGAARARTELAEIGVLQTTLLGEAARAIAAGDEQVAVVVGGEAKYRSLRESITGRVAPVTAQTDEMPDRLLRPAEEILSPIELEHGLVMPVQQYAVLENALRRADGVGVAEHRREIGRLWAGMSRVAAGNPDAWSRAVATEDELAGESEHNQMLAFPYTKRLTSQWNVDQAAALLLCSEKVADAAGVPPERRVYPWAAADSNFMAPVVRRRELARSPGFERTGARVLERTGIGIGDIAHLELYSCFPVAVRLQMRALGIGPERAITECGGMAFAGGPLNNFVYQALARMVGVLRADPGTLGLVTAVSGMLTKQGVTLWSTRPPRQEFTFDDVSGEVARCSPLAEIEPRPAGPAQIASTTVLYEGGRPAAAILVCDLPGGRRALARSMDPELVEHATIEEIGGRGVELGSAGPRLR